MGGKLGSVKMANLWKSGNKVIKDRYTFTDEEEMNINSGILKLELKHLNRAEKKKYLAEMRFDKMRTFDEEYILGGK